MALKIYNTLSEQIEEIKPLDGKQLRIYICGPTVYNFAHIGNFRTYVFQDIFRRYLKFKGFKVKQVMNLTDIDDKTIKGSQKECVPLKKFTERYTKAFFEDCETLHIERPEIVVNATEHIKEMLELIQKLFDKGIAYKGEDNCIYYNIRKFKDYGKLSHLNLSGLQAGARVKQDEYQKEQAQDFALWKAWDENDGKVFWESAFGKGRPGWHIECSAMSMKYLGETFDIHAGGVDLIFPHHENEIAQSEGATGKPFVKHWIHCKHLLVDGRKMSKSLGNFYTLRDLLAKGFKPMAIRWLLLSGHYRQELNFTFAELDSAAKTVERLNELIARLGEAKGSGTDIKEILGEALKGFEEGMDNDLNMPKALVPIFEAVKKINALIDANKISKENSKDILAFLKKIDSVLGVMDFEQKQEKLSKALLALIEKRESLRKQKKFAEADEIRKQLLEKGIQLLDTPRGAKWKRVEK